MSRKTASAKPKSAAKTKSSRATQRVHFFTTRRQSRWNIVSYLRNLSRRLNRRRHDFLSRRTHRTLKLTRRRDMPAAPQLPGYISFTTSVWRTILDNKGAYAALSILYALLSVLLVGIVQQDTYAGLSDSLKSVGPEIIGGNVDALLQATVVFGTAITGALAANMDGVQQLYYLLLFLLAWLSIVWFLRQRLAGQEVRARDAIYSSASPLVSTGIVALYGIIQCLPFALALIGYGVLFDLEIATNGFMAMMAGLGVGFVGVMTLYFLTSTLFAMIIVTLPGTYPWAAIRSAGDIAQGKRMPLLLRVAWLGAMIVVLWAIILIPFVLLSSIVPTTYGWVPIVPLTIQLLGSVSTLFGASYLYLLYRRMIDGAASR